MASVTISLYEAEKNKTFQVSSAPNIKLLESLGLRIGTMVTILNRYTFDGPVLLRVEDTYSLAIGKDIATQIGVKEVAVS